MFDESDFVRWLLLIGEAMDSTLKLNDIIRALGVPDSRSMASSRTALYIPFMLCMGHACQAVSSVLPQL